MAFYKPPPKFKRGEVKDDNEDEPVLRDIVSEGPGGRKGKGPAGSTSEARLKEMDAMPEFDVGISDPAIYDHLVALWKTRSKMKKKIKDTSPDNSSVGRRRAGGGRRRRALEGSFSQGRKSVGDSQLEMSAGGMSGVTAGETMLAPNLNASQTMNESSKPIRISKSKIAARDFLKGYSQETEKMWLRNPAAPKLLTKLGA